MAALNFWGNKPRKWNLSKKPTKIYKIKKIRLYSQIMYSDTKV